MRERTSRHLPRTLRGEQFRYRNSALAKSARQKLVRAAFTSAASRSAGVLDSPPPCRSAHPLFKIRDHRIRQFSALFFRRHREVLVLIPQRLDQQRILQIPRLHRRPIVSAAPDSISRIQRQPAFDLLRILRVAFVAFVRQHRPDLFLKKIALLGGDAVRCSRFDGKDGRGAGKEGGEVKRFHFVNLSGFTDPPRREWLRDSYGDSRSIFHAPSGCREYRSRSWRRLRRPCQNSIVCGART